LGYKPKSCYFCNMKKLMILAIFPLALACQKNDPSQGNKTTPTKNPGASCGSHQGHPVYKDIQGNCYFVNDDGTKEYVDNDECNC
jgi:hypothetical protein